jgi:hypothetical protein
MRACHPRAWTIFLAPSLLGRLATHPIEHFHEAPADRRSRLDPLDPSTSHHLGQCEYRDTTDPALLRVVLKVKDGASGDYWWVECSACDCAWQVPHYAAEKNVGHQSR